MAPLQISQHSFESCPIAKSPQGSPNPRQPLKRARMKLFSEQRELKRAKSQSHRFPARHWLEAREQPTCSGWQSHSGWTDSRLERGGRAGREKLHIRAQDPSCCPRPPPPTPGNRAARSGPRSLPTAFHTCQPPGKDIPISATMARAWARPQCMRVRLQLAEAPLPP